MKTKLLLAVALFMAAGTMAFAQITTGEPTSKVIKTGNRPEAGNFGVYLGATSNIFKAIDDDVEIKALPLINFKYMASKNMEYRLGLEMYKTSNLYKGDQIVSEEETMAMKSKNSESNVLLYPGFAYHFSSKNILDVYVGAELPFGLNSVTDRSASEYDGKEYSSSTTKRAFAVGLGAFIGLQAFIADLPLAIGAEFGVSSFLDCGLKYKHVDVSDGEKQTYYTRDLGDVKYPAVNEGGSSSFAPSTERYESLKARKGEIGSQFRLTLTYYFK